MNVLFVAMGTQTPSSRFRAQQFFPHLQAQGIRPTLRTGYGDGYNLHAGRPYAPAYKLAARLRRAALTVADVERFDAIFLQRTALPFTALPERLAARRNPRIVFDFDDAIYLGSSSASASLARRTFDQVVGVSAHVLAGNAHLASEAGAPDKTTVVPTVIDTDRYRPASGERADGPLTLGWMGTSGNFYQIERIVPALKRVLAERPGVRLRIVSNATFAPLADHPSVEQIRWSAEDEIALLQSFDIGLMPLDDTPWSRGKCGFKLIQYMAVGRAAVASAVGANHEIVPDAQFGRLVPDGEDWTAPLLELIDAAPTREAMGAAARSRIVEAYSVASVVPTLLRVLRDVANR